MTLCDTLPGDGTSAKEHIALWPWLGHLQAHRVPVRVGYSPMITFGDVAYICDKTCLTTKVQSATSPVAPQAFAHYSVRSLSLSELLQDVVDNTSEPPQVHQIWASPSPGFLLKMMTS